METLIFLLFSFFSITILTLIIVNIFLFKYSKKTNQKIDLLLDNGKIKDQKNILFSLIEKTKQQETDLVKATERIKTLEEIAQKTFQKSGVVRFNPFSNIGGNQSFAIALLDKKNDGFVISNLFVDQASRVYVKTVINGKSEYNLSEEEKEAITRAIES